MECTDDMWQEYLDELNGHDNGPELNEHEDGPTDEPCGKCECSCSAPEEYNCKCFCCKCTVTLLMLDGCLVDGVPITGKVFEETANIMRANIKG